MKRLILCLALLATACGKKSEPPKVDMTYVGDDYPVQETWNAKIVFSDSGRVKAILVAPHIAQYSRQGTLERRMDSSFRVDFFDDMGRHSSVITANRAVIHPNNDMEAFENVVVVSDDCTRITTEYMKWVSLERKIRSDKFVTITKPTETISGYGFESDQNLKNYRIFKASGQMRVKDDANF
ncbi:MAG: LPS export ABC transporter periplasmic protein LptC [Chloroherpetonaceae bacterium]|nr:LPS export ABC transporter periplasmic protein LptC [Chloroherpetonaceae bacterium]MDW8438325.1 LPS export ABC transporter periplasmic protein LptC [Chloroherpetonaceae bacterium]